jgi:hypothetical protein
MKMTANPRFQAAVSATDSQRTKAGPRSPTAPEPQRYAHKEEH